MKQTPEPYSLCNLLSDQGRKIHLFLFCIRKFYPKK